MYTGVGSGWGGYLETVDVNPSAGSESWGILLSPSAVSSLEKNTSLVNACGTELLCRKSNYSAE